VIAAGATLLPIQELTGTAWFQQLVSKPVGGAFRQWGGSVEDTGWSHPPYLKQQRREIVEKMGNTIPGTSTTSEGVKESSLPWPMLTRTNYEEWAMLMLINYEAMVVILFIA
jgi:hypothetical protein